METRLRDTLVTNKVFARELRNREDLDDHELRESEARLIAGTSGIGVSAGQP